MRLYCREWTTEKEINVFQDWGISGDITQTIDGTNIENLIPFKKGGSFGVTGSLSVPNEGGMRTNFQFTEACLDLGKWGTYKLPPVGAVCSWTFFCSINSIAFFVFVS
jgi:hypothetical protein